MLTIRFSRHPHEIVLLSICVLSGLSTFLAYHQAASTAIRELPEMWGRVYYLGLAIAAAIALIGVFWPGFTGPLVERAGLLMLSGLVCFFGIAILTVAGLRGLYFGLILIGFAAANLWRVGQVNRELQQIRAAAILTGSTEQLNDEGGGGP